LSTLIINKNDLRHNINIIKKQVDIDEYTIIGVVKGNGYGLGLKEYSDFLVENGITILATATTKESLELRKINKEVDILNMSATCIQEEIEQLVENDIIITIGSNKCAEIANKIASTGKKIRAHIKIDTGFGRYGFVHENKNIIVETIKNLNKNIKLEGIFTHFSLAYYNNNKETLKQFDNFLKVVQALEKENININLKHVCNSPAFINYPQMRLNSARIGSAFLGRVDAKTYIGLKRIGELKTKVAEIKTLPKNFNVGYLNTYKTKKQTRVAIIPVGYKDGFNVGTKNDMFRTVDNLRDLKHAIHNMFTKQSLKVQINEKNYNVIGKIGMYHMTVDILNDDINVGDTVDININPLYIDSTVERKYE